MRWARAIVTAVALLLCRSAPGDAQHGAVVHSIEVRENAVRADSRRIPLSFIVLPAFDGARRAPLFVLQGGPGIPGATLVTRFANDSALRRHRDIVLLDQRGTGASNRLSCDQGAPLAAIRDTLFPPEFIARCRASLASRADVAMYTTAASADDVEAVRKHLGAERVDLLGISYGSRLAQAYLSVFGTHVGRVVLDGVVPLDALISLEAAVHIDRALDMAVRTCEEDDVCRLRHPTVRRALGELRNSDRLPPGRRWRIAYALRGALYGDPLRVPRLIDEAARGQYGAIDSVAAERSRFVSGTVGTALHLSVNCSEDIPHVRGADVRRRSRGSLMGDMYWAQYHIGCGAWGVVPGSVPRPMPVQGHVQALLFSGDHDPVTPPEYGERITTRFQAVRHVVFTRSGHAVHSVCKAGIMAAFLNGLPLGELSVACA